MANTINAPIDAIADAARAEDAAAGPAAVTHPANAAVRDLSLWLGSNTVIENLDLDVLAGEFVVLLGPSGCGKSTLLHSIAGLIDTEAGSGSIGGRDVTWADPKAAGLGMGFQSYALYPTMN